MGRVLRASREPPGPLTGRAAIFVAFQHASSAKPPANSAMLDGSGMFEIENVPEAVIGLLGPVAPLICWMETKSNSPSDRRNVKSSDSSDEEACQPVTRSPLPQVGLNRYASESSAVPPAVSQTPPTKGALAASVRSKWIPRQVTLKAVNTGTAGSYVKEPAVGAVPLMAMKSMVCEMGAAVAAAVPIPMRKTNRASEPFKGKSSMFPSKRPYHALSGILRLPRTTGAWLARAN